MIPLTPELERNLQREHDRMHPGGLKRSGAVCDVCLLLYALEEERKTGVVFRKQIPRCGSTTARGYRCARSVGHQGPHDHPRDHETA